MNAVFNPLSQRQPFKIILIGTSGGAQVALAAAPYLDVARCSDHRALYWGVLPAEMASMWLNVFTISEAVETGLRI